MVCGCGSVQGHHLLFPLSRHLSTGQGTEIGNYSFSFLSLYSVDGWMEENKDRKVRQGKICINYSVLGEIYMEEEKKIIRQNNSGSHVTP